MLLTDELWMGGSNDLLQGFMNLLVRLKEFRETLHLLDSQFITEDIKEYEWGTWGAQWLSICLWLSS